jgi:hypothetical protein
MMGGRVCALQFTLTEEPPMTTRRRLGDRRNRVRYEIVGQLWGSLETFEPMEVHNISQGGALVESRVPLNSESVQRFRLTTPDQTLDLQGRVTHVSQRQDVTAPENFLVGVQFVSLPQPALDYIEGYVADNLAAAVSSLPEGEA